MNDASSPSIRPAASKAKLVCLDGLRGLAVLLVVGYHMGNSDGTGLSHHPIVTGALLPFRIGFTGVHLFLVLSGFCLAHSLLRRSRAGRSPSYLEYLSARWWRIAPPYYVALACFLAIPSAYLLLGRASSTTSVLNPRQVLTHLSFTHGFFADTIDAIETPFWSLSLEFQFYLVLPWVVALMARAGAWPVLIASVVVSLGWRAGLIHAWTDHLYLMNGALPGRIAEFVMGAALAFAYNADGRRPGTIGPGRLAASPSWLVATGLACIGIGAGLFQWKHELTTDVVFGAGYAFLLAAALAASEALETHGALGRSFAGLTGAAWLVWAGTVSYSIYLTHGFLVVRSVQIYRRLAPRPGLSSDVAWMISSLALVMLVGWGYHRLVERRFLRSVEGGRPREIRTEAAPLLVSGAG